MDLNRAMKSAVAVGTVVSLVGCAGSGDADTGGPTTDTPNATAATTPPPSGNVPPTAAATSTPTSSSSSSTSSSAPFESSTSTSTSSSTTTSTTSTVAPTTAPAADRAGFEAPSGQVVDAAIEIPAGEFVQAPGDVIVNRPDHLEYLPNALSPGNEAPPIVLTEYAETLDDDRLTIALDVAGIVNGSVIVGGNDQTFAIDAEGSVVGPIATGDDVQLSPDGTLLATATETTLSVFDIASGNGQTLELDASAPHILDIEWLDGDTVGTMGYREGDETYEVVRHDAATLARSTETTSFDIGARFAGRTADGFIGVQTWDDGDATVRYFDANLEEQPELEQTFVSSTTIQFIEIESGGLGQIWVDEFRLYYLGPNQFEPRFLDDVVTGAWFVEST